LHWNAYGSRNNRINQIANHLIIGVIDTLQKMASTIAACFDNDVKIRWFDFHAFAKSQPLAARGGDPNLLIPVNSREVRPSGKPLSIGQILRALALSVANRRSLVFLRPEEPDEPGVLFTADSKLKHVHRYFPFPIAVDQSRRLIVTAMHHASKSNAPGYGVLRKWLGANYPPIFIRNGGFMVDYVAADFRAVADRLCVRCIGASVLTGVQLQSRNGVWQHPPKPTRCTC